MQAILQPSEQTVSLSQQDEIQFDVFDLIARPLECIAKIYAGVLVIVFTPCK